MHIIKLIEHGIESTLADIDPILTNGGQAGHGIVVHEDAVIAHHGDVLGHPLAQVVQGPDDPHGHHVADGENGGEVGAALQQTAGGGMAAGGVRR